MSKTYLCWVPAYDEDMESAQPFKCRWATDKEDAVREYWEYQCNEDCNYPDETVVMVCDADADGKPVGEPESYTVTIEHVAHYSANKNEPKPAPDKED